MPLTHKITAIKQQAKRRDRYSIFIDGRYTCSLSEQQLVDESIASGDEIDAARLSELTQKSGFGKAYDKALNYLSYRPRSRHEVETYLKGKSVEPEVIAQIVEQLVDQNLLNDRVFAETWASERRQYGRKSLKQLEVELMQKGIDRDLIKEVLAGIDTVTDDVAVIKELIESKGLQKKYADEQRLIRYLQGKGFRYSNIKAALEQL